jgi:urease accessory protein
MSMKIVLLTAIFVSLAGAAFAHTGVASSGFMHPISGLDHFLVMTSVGMMTWMLGGRAVWLLPLSFILAMVMGGALALSDVALPALELVIAVSVVVVGCLIAAGGNVPLKAATAIVAVFALFHGHAHVAEMPLGISVAAYTAGFVVATTALHGCGLTFGLALQRIDALSARKLARAIGSIVAVVGLGILVGAI